MDNNCKANGVFERWTTELSGLNVSSNKWNLKVAKKPNWWQMTMFKIGSFFIKKVL